MTNAFDASPRPTLDPRAARPPGRAEVEAAHERLAGYARRTPLLRPGAGAFGVEAALSIKLEASQHAGSFKTRGAFANLLDARVPAAGVAAASGGNHGAAVAYAARTLGLRARIFTPTIAAPAKLDAIRAFGAQVVVEGERYDDARARCEAYCEATGALNVHPYDAVATVAGQGSCFKEWEEQLDGAGLDVVLAAVGGGGLIAGACAWWGGRVKIVGVEPVGSRALHAALEAGAPVDVEVRSIAADSLGAKRVGDLPFALARTTGVASLLVSDEAIAEAQRRLWREARLAVEPGGATALAALVSGVYRPEPGERVGVLLCGGNVDLDALARTCAAA